MRACRYTDWTLSLALTATLASIACGQKNAAPTAEQALLLKPIQSSVEYAKPSRDESKRCTIKPERDGKETSWVVRDPSGQVIRRFADTNGDNVVDMWCYYLNGLEVYRDLDSNFDNKADQYRWLHTGGTRWGIDRNQDGKIDSWKQISAEEVAEEAVLALQQQDKARFARLLISESEIKGLGMGSDLAKQVTGLRKNAMGSFTKIASSQKSVNSKSRFVDFGAAKPGVVPAGSGGSTKDVLVYENASALIDNGGTPEQVLLGSIFRVGDGWRLVDAPTIGDSRPELSSVFSIPGRATLGSGGAEPTDQMQKWMEQLEQLDKKSPRGDKEFASLTNERATLLAKLADATSGEESRQWYSQLADLLNAAAQSNGYAAAVKQLAQLESAPGVKRLGKEMVGMMRYRRISAEYGLALRNPKADYPKVQATWIKNLEAFVKAFPTGPEAADAMLQLGMSEEFSGETDKAKAWYGQLRKEFPRTTPGRKAAGALWRLDSVGKVFPLSGNAIGGGKIDLTKSPYRGRTVVVQYWATWCEPCKDDMKQLAKLQQKYGKKLAVVGVNLDNSVEQAKAYLKQSGNKWNHLYDEQGLEGQRASEVGAMTLPLMILVDKQGKVVNRTLHGGELEDELKRTIR